MPPCCWRANLLGMVLAGSTLMLTPFRQPWPLPEGFHLAAAEVYRRLESFKNRATPPSMAEVNQAMQRSAPVEPNECHARCK